MDTSTKMDASRLLPEHRANPFDALLANEAQLGSKLRELDIVPLLLVYTHLTKDETFLDRFAPHIKGAWSSEVEAPDPLQDELRRALIGVFKAYRAAGRAAPPAPDSELLQRMCDVGVGGQMPAEYLPMVVEELNFDLGDAKTVHWRRRPSPKESEPSGPRSATSARALFV